MNYQTYYTEGYLGSNGYMGENYHLWNYSEKELKKLLLQEYKKNGIKASIRKNRGGWTTSLTITISANESDLTEEVDEWEKQYGAKYGIQVNQYRNYDDRFTEDFNRKLNLIYQITNSFNYNKSNGMVDYYDVGFYYGIRVKC